MTTATAAGSDDLETIEGIGPAIAALLRANGIYSYAELASYRAAQLRQILHRDRDLALAEPSTWAFQARLLSLGRHGDFVRLIARLDCGVPRLSSVVEACCAARLRAGGICTIAELQRSTVWQVVNCFAENDRANITRLAPRWIDHAHRLHEGDEASLCALAGIDRVSGSVGAEAGRADVRRTAVRTASVEEMEAADAGLIAYWRRENWFRLLCVPLLSLALLLFLLFFALLGLIPSRGGPGPGVIVPGPPGSTRVVMPAGGTAIWMIPGGWVAYGPYGLLSGSGSNGQYWLNDGRGEWYGPYPPAYPPGYPPSNPPGSPPSNPPGFPPSNPPGYPPSNPPGYPPTNPPGYPPGYPPANPPGYPPGYPPSNPPGYPPSYPPGYPPGYPPSYPPGQWPAAWPASCCPTCPQSPCPPYRPQPRPPRPQPPQPEPCDCDVPAEPAAM